MTMKGVYTRTVRFEGAATSSAVPTGGGALVGFYNPASMAGTSIQVEAANGDQANEPGTFVGVFDNAGARVSATLSSAAGYRLFDQSKLTFGADFVRLVSSASETATCVLVFQEVC